MIEIHLKKSNFNRNIFSNLYNSTRRSDYFSELSFKIKCFFLQYRLMDRKVSPIFDSYDIDCCCCCFRFQRTLTSIRGSETARRTYNTVQDNPALLINVHRSRLLDDCIHFFTEVGDSFFARSATRRALFI